MSFALDLQKFAEKAQDKCDEAVGGIVFNIALDLDKLSPVGDPTQWTEEFKKVGKELGWYGDGYVGGRFRGNWQLGINTMPSGETGIIDSGAKDGNGGVATGRIAAAIPDQATGNLFYISNNVPYARRLEYGYSKQAPTGLVGLTVARFQQIVREAVEAVQ